MGRRWFTVWVFPRVGERGLISPAMAILTNSDWSEARVAMEGRIVDVKTGRGMIEATLESSFAAAVLTSASSS